MATEKLDGGRLKGAILKARLQWLEEKGLGDPASLVSRVSKETAAVLQAPILPVAWYPFRALVEVDRAIAAVAGGDERAAITELGRHSARLNLGGSLRFYNRSQPHEFFAGVERMHGLYMDFGREHYEPTGPTSGTISLLELRCWAKAYCWSAAGYYEQATALQGGRDPVIVERECACDGDAACLFDLRWS